MMHTTSPNLGTVSRNFEPLRGLQARASATRLWCLQVLLLAVSAWLVSQSWGCAQLESSAPTWGGVLLCGLAGLGARGSRPWRTRVALTIAFTAIACLTLPWCHQVVLRSRASPWFHTLGDLFVGLAPLMVFGGFVVSRHPRFGLVLGFSLALACGAWRPHQAHLGAAVFLLARDLGKYDAQTPTRQHFALVGVGLLAGTFVAALAFDLAATLAYGEHFTRYGHRAGYLGDAPLSRWMRMATEVALIASCFAYSRGRTWGVLGLLVVLPFLLFQLVVFFTSGGHLPHWSSGGCFRDSHPFDHTEYTPAALLLAITPWYIPILRALAPAKPS
ncbi:MAG: hypothetical protein ACI9KE_005057 [Polyangiales bacterium]|jgi:hypothetical protein